ncbi:hypothetical protein ADU37_CDS19950 [Thermococcus sp. 2319x1]|nr:hypothetical protein ADU37_CDS19950 [Thermococcus sp. 2319x1]
MIENGEIVDLTDPEIIELIKEKLRKEVKLVNVLIKGG